MRKGRDRGMLIYPPARPQAPTPIQGAVYLLNRAVRSESVRRQGVAPPWYGVKGVRGCNSSVRSQGSKELPLQSMYTESNNRKGNMNVLSTG